MPKTLNDYISEARQRLDSIETKYKTLLLTTEVKEIAEDTKTKAKAKALKQLVFTKGMLDLINTLPQIPGVKETGEFFWNIGALIVELGSENSLFTPITHPMSYELIELLYVFCRTIKSNPVLIEQIPEGKIRKKFEEFLEQESIFLGFINNYFGKVPSPHSQALLLMQEFIANQLKWIEEKVLYATSELKKEIPLEKNIKALQGRLQELAILQAFLEERRTQYNTSTVRSLIENSAVAPADSSLLSYLPSVLPEESAGIVDKKIQIVPAKRALDDVIQNAFQKIEAKKAAYQHALHLAWTVKIQSINEAHQQAFDRLSEETPKLVNQPASSVEEMTQKIMAYQRVNDSLAALKHRMLDFLNTVPKDSKSECLDLNNALDKFMAELSVKIKNLNRFLESAKAFGEESPLTPAYKEKLKEAASNRIRELEHSLQVQTNLVETLQERLRTYQLSLANNGRRHAELADDVHMESIDKTALQQTNDQLHAAKKDSMLVISLKEFSIRLQSFSEKIVC